MNKKFIIAALFSFWLTPFVQQTHAQTPELEIYRRADSNEAIPITMSGFSGTAQEVLKFDLEVHGFIFVGNEAAKFILTGGNNGQVEGRLTDKNKTSLLARAYTGGSVRSQAHALANDVIFAITQRKGITDKKIAFRVEEGKNDSEIYVADFDGANAVAVTSDNSFTAAPNWVPGERKILYVSYKATGLPQILSHDLSTGARKKIAAYGGINSGPAVSPDGKRIAMILGKSGNAELYVSNIDGSDLKQLTKSREGESSPTWSADGREICYVADSGRASLYKISANGGTPTRLRTAGVGGNLTEPDWSPDGKTITFTSQTGKYFNVCVVPANGGDAKILVEGEDSAWAPNSRTIIFTRRKSGGRVLSLLDVPTKRVKDVTRISGSSSQPCWAK